MIKDKMGPKTEDYSSDSIPCLVCGRTFKRGEFTTLVVIGVEDDENRRKRDEGRAHTAVSVEVHWECRP